MRNGLIIFILFISWGNLFSLEIDAKIIEIIDYISNDNNQYTAIFLDENNDNKFDKVLHIPYTDDQLTFVYRLRQFLKKNDLIKYEYGDHVKPQWENWSKKLQSKFGIEHNLIIDLSQIIEINGESILFLLNYNRYSDKWKESIFPYAYKKIK